MGLSVTKKLKRRHPKPALDWEFEQVWLAYPRKVGKGAALKAYKARRRAGVSFGELGEAVGLYAKQRAGQDPEFTMRGATFFGPDERWREPFEAKAEGNGKASDGKYRPPVTDLGALDA
jgi:hypothetical protein